MSISFKFQTKACKRTHLTKPAAPSRFHKMWQSLCNARKPCSSPSYQTTTVNITASKWKATNILLLLSTLSTVHHGGWIIAIGLYLWTRRTCTFNAKRRCIESRVSVHFNQTVNGWWHHKVSVVTHEDECHTHVWFPTVITFQLLPSSW